VSDGDSPAKALETGLEEDLIPAVEDASQAVEGAVKSVGTGVQGAAGRYETVEAGNTDLLSKKLEGSSQAELADVSSETQEAAQTIAPKSQSSSSTASPVSLRSSTRIGASVSSSPPQVIVPHRMRATIVGQYGHHD